MERYYPRVLDEVLAFKLRSCGAVQIKGPKWCGKSTTAEQAAASAVYLQDRRSSAQAIELARNAPDLFLAGDAPRLIDEWQVVPFIWDDIRYEVDRRGENGQFILTGSATPLAEDADDRRHSGIGRIAPVTMRPMTLRESEDGPGGVSLAALFAKDDVKPCQCGLSLEDYAYLTCRGGWPRALSLDREEALEQAFVFVEGLEGEDINRMFRRTVNPTRIHRLLRSYARATATETSLAELRKDIMADEAGSFSEQSVVSYIDALRRLYVIEDLDAWSPNLRSKTAIRTSSTRHFVDPSIGCAALGVGPGALLDDLRTFGLFFESLCIRDLRVYAEALKGKVSHYRDANGLEADAVVHLRDGSWAAVEVKLASSQAIDEGARHLRKLSDKIDTDRMGPPSFLMVLTATQYAYRREDGVYVVPLGCLER